MPKLNASIADVSTDFVPPDPGIPFTFEVVDIQPVKSKESPDTFLGFSIISEVADEGDNRGRRMFDRCTELNEDGTVNQFGPKQIKRYMEAILGKDVVKGRGGGDDIDLDELRGGQFTGEVKHTKGVKDGEERTYANFKTILPLN